MIKRILTICAAVSAGAAGISLAQAQQVYPAPQGSVYSQNPPPYQGGYPADYRRGGPQPSEFDSLDDDDSQNPAAMPPPGPPPADPRYARSVPQGPILSPDDPRYANAGPTGAMPTGPVMSPDDPRYGRPSGPPAVIYADPAGPPPQSYQQQPYQQQTYQPTDGNGALRPPGAVTGAEQPAATGPDGRPMTVASLPPEEQPDVGPAELPPNLRRQEVSFNTKEPAGTIVVDTPNTYLYYVLGNGRAVRYGVRVGRDGFTWTGVQKITRKKEWPDWYPPSEMIERQPYLPRFMAGGPGNPLGARAMYLGSTVYRIHGTNQPSTIGKFVSSGCIGMLNDDVSDLFDRAKVGTRVVVLPGGPPPGTATASAQPMPGPAAVGVAGPPPAAGANVPGTQPTAVPPLPAPVQIR